MCGKLKVSEFDVIIKLPNELLTEINRKKMQRKEQLRNPHLLILWIGYKKYFDKLISGIKMPVKILGLRIEWTDVPDTVEVF